MSECQDHSQGDLGVMWDGSGICTGVWFEDENDPPVTRDVKVQPQAIPNHRFFRGGLRTDWTLDWLIAGNYMTRLGQGTFMVEAPSTLL